MVFIMRYVVRLPVGDFLLCVGTAPGISASPSEENMRYFNVMILGPSQSPYEGMLYTTLF